MPELTAPGAGTPDERPAWWPAGWVWTGLAGPNGDTPSRFTYDEWVQDLRDNAEARRNRPRRPDDINELRRRLEETHDA